MADPYEVAYGGGSSGKTAAQQFEDAKKKRRKAADKRKKSKSAKPKDEKRGGLLGLAENLVHDLGDAAQGIPVGLWETTKAIGHDAKDLVDGGGHDFKLDDLGKATVDAITWTYEPLADNDWKEFGRRVYEHPLGPVLDAFTVVTLGAGGAVKGAKLAGDVGMASKLTGGKVRKLSDGEDPKLALDRSRMGLARGQKGAGMLSRDGSSIMEPAPRLLTSKAQRSRDKLPSPLSPRSKDQRAEGEGVVRVGDYAENPIRRMQQRAFDAISEATGLAEKRISHETRKLERNAARRRSQSAGVNAAAKTVRSKEMKGLGPEAKRAFANQSVKGNTDDVQGVAAERSARMVEDFKRVADESDAPERQAALLERVIGRRKDDDARDAVAEVQAKLNSRAYALRHRAALVEDKLRGAKLPGGVVIDPKPFAMGDKTPDPNEVTRLYEAAAKAEENARILGRALIDPEGTLRDYKQVAKIRQDPLAMEQMIATMKVQATLAARGLDAAEMKSLNRLMEIARPVVEGEGGSDQLLAETAAMRGAVGPRSKSDRGIEEEGFAVSRSSSRDYKGRAERQGAANRHSPARMRQPDASKMTEGFNERFGLDAAEPQNVVATHEVVNRFRQSMGMWRQAVDAMKPMGAFAGELPKGYSEVPRGVATRFLQDARAFLDDEAPVIYGETHPAIDQAREVILEGFAARFAEGPVMVPTKLLKHLEQEMKPQGRLPLIDNLTGLWRVSVVSPLRPAFVANNILGQTAMLGVAHGGLGTLRGILHHARYGKDLDQYTGAVIGSGQAAALMRETSSLLNNEGMVTGKARQFNEVLGRISQALTDDPFRRIAFAKEIMPTARRVEQRNRGKMVTDKDTGAQRPYMMKDALDELLSDEDTISRIERKVLDDLVDFDDLSRAERMVVRRILPFYGWIKGSGKVTVKLMLDNPLLADFYYRQGQLGNAVLEEEAGGSLPQYMKGLLDLNDIGKDGKDPRAFTTAQFNQFVTPSDTLAQLGFVLGIRDPDAKAFNPDNPLSQVAPVWKAAAAGLTGKDPFSGQDMSAGQVFANSFPLVSSYGLPGGALGLEGAANKRDGVYGKSAKNELFKYLGFPVRENVDVAKALDYEENPRVTLEVYGKKGGKFFVGPDGRLYLDVGKPKPKKKD
jgi:hypothetical protein